MAKKPTVLMILDGFGLNDNKEANAAKIAKTPVIDKLMAEYPFVKGYASGMAVGLPEGQMGNSEVGHLNMGAGRIVYQDLTGISLRIRGCSSLSITARKKILPCICMVCSRAAVCTATTRICMGFWNLQSARV